MGPMGWIAGVDFSEAAQPGRALYESRRSPMVGMPVCQGIRNHETRTIPPNKVYQSLETLRRFREETILPS
jgi:hypothetical protein